MKKENSVGNKAVLPPYVHAMEKKKGEKHSRNFENTKRRKVFEKSYVHAMKKKKGEKHLS